MNLLRITSFSENRRAAFGGLACGVALAIMVHYFQPSTWPSLFALALLSFPFRPRTPAERALRSALVGFYASLGLAFAGRAIVPLAWVAGLGCGAFGAVVFCLRYGRPGA